MYTSFAQFNDVEEQETVRLRTWLHLNVIFPPSAPQIQLRGLGEEGLMLEW